MSETTIIERDQRSGRFLSGCKPGPGRGVGSRNRLQDQFILDIADLWKRRGAECLERIADTDPATVVRVISQLLPKTVDLNLSSSIDVTDFAERFRHAVEMLGNEPKVKTIEHVAKRR